MAAKITSTAGAEAPNLASALDVQGMPELHVVQVGRHKVLELRHMLGLAREAFGRLVDVSVRTLAAVETRGTRADKLQRNYLEVQRLCVALAEVIQPEELGAWLTRPNPGFGGMKPLELIERGEIHRLWELCFRLRAGLPT